MCFRADEETRVRLAAISSDPTSDYINASHVTVRACLRLASLAHSEPLLVLVCFV